MGCPPSAWGRAGAKVPISMAGIERPGTLLETRVEGGPQPIQCVQRCGHCQQTESHMQGSL